MAHVPEVVSLSHMERKRSRGGTCGSGFGSGRYVDARVQAPEKARRVATARGKISATGFADASVSACPLLKSSARSTTPSTPELGLLASSPLLGSHA